MYDVQYIIERSTFYVEINAGQSHIVFLVYRFGLTGFVRELNFSIHLFRPTHHHS